MKCDKLNLRRMCNLIDKINNIVDVEQNEIDCENVKFEKFEILFASKFATNK